MSKPQPPRPMRRQITYRKPATYYRVPLIGPVTPRLQRPAQSGHVADAIGFQRLTEGYWFEGAWVRKSLRSEDMK
jgi:hypothetical protein